jgi:hypothetical protein
MNEDAAAENKSIILDSVTPSRSGLFIEHLPEKIYGS